MVWGAVFLEARQISQRRMLKSDDDTFKLHESSGIEISLSARPEELLGGEMPPSEHLRFHQRGNLSGLPVPGSGAE
jgi:hypothetical protein